MNPLLTRFSTEDLNNILQRIRVARQKHTAILAHAKKLGLPDNYWITGEVVNGEFNTHHYPFICLEAEGRSINFPIRNIVLAHLSKEAKTSKLSTQGGCTVQGSRERIALCNRIIHTLRVEIAQRTASNDNGSQPRGTGIENASV